MPVSYGTRTALDNVDRLHSNANSVVEAFGEVVNSAGAHAINIYLVVPISASATTGTYDLHVVESQNGVDWTDNIDPANAGDVAAKLADARFLASAGTIYNATDRTSVRIHATIPFTTRAQYIGLVLSNKSGQTIPASGATGHYTLLTIS